MEVIVEYSTKDSGDFASGLHLLSMQRLTYDGPIGWLEHTVAYALEYPRIFDKLYIQGERNAYALGWKVIYKGDEYHIFQNCKKNSDYDNTKLPNENVVPKMLGKIDLLTASGVVIPSGMYGPGGKAGFGGDSDFSKHNVYVEMSEMFAVEESDEEIAIMPIGQIDFGEIDESFWLQLQEKDRNCLVLKRSDAMNMLNEDETVSAPDNMTMKVVEYIRVYCC